MWIKVLEEDEARIEKVGENEGTIEGGRLFRLVNEIKEGEWYVDLEQSLKRYELVKLVVRRYHEKEEL